MGNYYSLQVILDADREQLSRYERIAYSPRYIEATNEMVTPGKEFFNEEYIYKTDLAGKVFAITGMSILFFLSIYLLVGSSVRNDKIAGVIFFLIYFLSLLGLIRRFFFNENLNYKIKLNETGIWIMDDFYSWQNIAETAILTYSPHGKRRHLIVVYENGGSFKKYDLRNFNILGLNKFHRKLSTAIEYFKGNR